MYSPIQGQFLSEDPLGFDAHDTNLSRYVRNNPTNATDPSGLREVDDRETEETAKLVDVTGKLEDHVNDVIADGRKELKIGNACTNAQRDKLLQYVFDHLGQDRKGTGILGLSLLSEIEHWLETSLDPDQNESYRPSFADSRYGDNPVGAFAGKVPAHKTRGAADHSMGSTIRINGGDDPVLTGTDKWGHFFQQGWWYYQNREKLAALDKKGNARAAMMLFGMYMEGDPEFLKQCTSDKTRAQFQAIARQYLSLFKFGYFGSASSGVVSTADQAANLAGYRFYEGLADDPVNFKFRVGDYHAGDFNEVRLDNQFINGFKFKGNGSELPPPAPDVKAEGF